MRQVDFDVFRVINKVWLRESIKEDVLEDLCYAKKNNISIYFCKKVCVDEDYVYLYDVYVKRAYKPKLPIGYTLMAHPFSTHETFHGILVEGLGPNENISVTFGKVLPVITVPKDQLYKISSHADMTEMPKDLQRTQKEAKEKAQGMITPLPPSRIWNIKEWDEVVKLAKEYYEERQKEEAEVKYRKEYRKKHFLYKAYFWWKYFNTRNEEDPYINEKMKDFKVDYSALEEYYHDLKKNGVNNLIKEKRYNN